MCVSAIGLACYYSHHRRQRWATYDPCPQETSLYTTRNEKIFCAKRLICGLHNSFYPGRVIGSIMVDSSSQQTDVHTEDLTTLYVNFQRFSCQTADGWLKFAKAILTSGRILRNYMRRIVIQHCVIQHCVPNSVLYEAGSSLVLWYLVLGYYSSGCDVVFVECNIPQDIMHKLQMYITGSQSYGKVSKCHKRERPRPY